MSFGQASGGPGEASQEYREALLLIIAALVVRVVVFVGIADLPFFLEPEIDARIYDQAARQIAGGDILYGHEVLRMSPGYFYFLAAVYKLFGAGPWGFRAVQGLMGIGTVLILWRTARAMFSPRIALLVGFCTALYEPFAFYDGVNLCESLAIFLLATWIWLCVRTLAAPSPGKLVAASALWGLLCDVRPNTLLLALPLAFVVWRSTAQLSTSRRVGWVALAGLIGALAIAPVTVRNYLATGQPVALVGHSGINLYMGNGRGATGSYRVPEDVGEARDFAVFRTTAERLVGKPLSDKEADDYWKQRTLAEVLADPLAWLRLMLKKTRLFLNGREIPDVYDLTFLRTASPLLGAPLLQLVCIAPFAWLGLFFLWRRGDGGRFLLLTIGSYAAGIVAVFVIARYRIPIVCALMLAAGACFQELAAAWESRSPHRGGALAAALTVSLVLVWPVGIKQTQSPATNFFELGTKYQMQGRLDRALEAYFAALRLDAAHVPTHNNLAILYEKQHIFDAAIAEWKVVLAASQPGDAAAVQRARGHLEHLQSGSAAVSP